MLKVDKNLTILIAVAALFIAAVAVFSLNTQSDIKELVPATIAQPVLQDNSLLIDDGSGDVQTVELSVKKSSSAFDLLKKGTGRLGLELKTKFYEDMGVFIEAIGDKENGQEGKYWLYYVNDKMPSVAADKQTLKEGDKVEFKFEKSPF